MKSPMLELQALWRKNWLRRSLISLVILTLILILIPVGIQFAITSVLLDRGAKTASLQDVDLNLFSGRLALSNLQYRFDGQDPAQMEQMHVDIDMLSLFVSQIVVEDINLRGVNVKVNRDEDGTIALNGLVLVAAEQSAANESVEPSGNSVDFALRQAQLADVTVSYSEPEFAQQLRLERLSLANVVSWQPESTASLQLALAIDDAPLQASADLKLFSVPRQALGDINLQRLDLKAYEKFYREYLASLSGLVSLQTSFDLVIAEQVTGQVKPKVTIADLTAQYQELEQSSEQIVFSGNINLAAANQVAVNGDLEISGNRSRDSGQNYTISSFDTLRFGGFTFQDSTIGLGGINLRGLKLVQTEGDKQLLDLQNLDIEKVRFEKASNRVAIEEIRLQQPLAQITIDPEKRLLQLVPLLQTIANLQADSDDSRAAEEVAEQPVAEAAPLHLAINSILLEQPGKIEFIDQSIDPDYQTEIHLNQVEIKRLTTSDPAEFKFALKKGDYTTIQVDGNGLLMNPTQQLEVTANIRHLDLPPVTPYTSAVMGYGMKSGVIDTDVSARIDNNEIDSTIDLKIDSIEVVETDQKTAEQVSSASGMSIDLAISTLKDKNNVIELKLPVKGNLDAPDFDLSHVINKALGKAMQSASLSYLKHSLQPFGSLITLFSLVNAAANHISLPPLIFATNSIEFEAAEQSELIDKVLKVLQERPALKIKACGVSALADQQAIRAQLIVAETEKLKQQLEKDGKEIPAELEVEIPDEQIQDAMKKLADQRAARVKAYFIDQGGLESRRILNCLSASKLEDDSKPSVELQI